MVNYEKHILVVDDEAALRFAVTAILERLGYRVTAACDGNQAKLVLSEARKRGDYFDLMLLDIHMPYLNGDSLFKELVHFDRCPPVLMISGDCTGVNLDFLQDAHCLGLIEKPINASTLREKVADAFSAVCNGSEVTCPTQGGPGNDDRDHG